MRDLFRFPTYHTHHRGNQRHKNQEKVVALSPFPSLQAAINVCSVWSEEAARANERSLSGQSGISAIQNKRSRPEHPQAKDTKECGACGRFAHPSGSKCPAFGWSGHACGKLDNFAPKCPSRDKGKSSGIENGSGGAGGGAAASSSSGSKSKVGHITIGNAQAYHRQRGSPTITLEVLDSEGTVTAVITDAVPDPDAEVSVAGSDIMAAIVVTEKDIHQLSFDLVMADRRTSLLSIEKRDLMISYGGRCVPMTVMFCPEIRGMLICRLDCVNDGRTRFSLQFQTPCVL